MGREREMKRFYKVSSIVLSTICLLQTVAFASNIDYVLSKNTGENVKRVKISEKAPYVASRENPTPFYYNDEFTEVEPLFRVKFNEGTGNTVKESVSGKEATIVGEDYEWVENAEIRYGCMTPVTYRSNTALKLNNSYINLGKLDNLKFEKDGMTIVYWTNYEIKGRNEDYVEPSHHQSYTYGSYKSAYKLDKDINHMLLKCGGMSVALHNEGIKFPGISDSLLKYEYSVVNNDNYNMYYIKIKKVGNSYKAQLSANERMNMSASAAVSNWKADIFENMSQNDLYIGTANPSASERSPQMGIADLMIFDGALNYWELMNVYYGYNQVEYQESKVIQNAE